MKSYMQAKPPLFSKMDAILKTILESATSNSIYLVEEKIMKSYDTSKSTGENKEVLESSYNKEQLNLMVYFTETLSQSLAIVQRITQRKSRNKSKLAKTVNGAVTKLNFRDGWTFDTLKYN